jgi:7,8-dihydro-6-hydroxymethylpterin dimethyltransferase
MSQVTIDVFGLQLPAHQILELLAYGVGFQLYLFFRRRWPSGPTLTLEQTGWIMIGAIFGALIGARVLAIAEAFPTLRENGMDWRIILGAKTIVGAILGGWVGVEIAKRRLGIGHPTGDIYVFPLIAGMCIGRIGCFLGGIEDHTYGIVTTLPWGVDFGDGLKRHPTQLYEIAFLLCLAGYFAWRIKTLRQRGCMFSRFMLGYLGFRLFVDFIKPRDLLPLIHLGAIQVACLAGIAYALKHRNDQCCGRAKIEPAQQKEPKTSHPGEFTELTVSLCPTCLRKVEAKVVVETDGVFLRKFCQEHGSQQVMVADDSAYWRESRRLYMPPTAPLRRNTQMRLGCPWDCGLCPDHEQHSCLAIVEITSQCDLQCSFCYAAAGPQSPHRTIAQIEHMLDSVIENEGHANVVQISGGEPTQHPDLFSVLDAAKARPIGHLMLNTNGKRIAEESGFAERLVKYMPGFEVYLQFDSNRPETLRRLRGTDLSRIRRRALEALNQHNISTTLVVALKKGCNDQEIGEILDFSIKQPCVRGVTFQPIQAAGRLNGFEAARDRITLTEVRNDILRQHSLFSPEDLVPVPCHADALAIGYAIRRGSRLVPLSRLIDPRRLLNIGGNTICYEQDPEIQHHVKQLFSASASPVSAARDLNGLCCTPERSGLHETIHYDEVFRVIIMQFMDAWNMDLRSLKRSCVHIVHPDGRLIPFEVYNIFHRDGIVGQKPELDQEAVCLK